MAHPFTGTIEFSVHLKLLGTTLMRRLRVTYEYTPKWPFFDPMIETETTEMEKLRLDLEILAKPQADGPLGSKSIRREPNWSSANQLLRSGLLNSRVYERIDAWIDGEARAQDLERRQKAQSPDPQLPNSI